MVLVKNNGEKEINLAWGSWSYGLKVGEEKEIPDVAAEAMRKRFKGVEIKKKQKVEEVKKAVEKKVEEKIVVEPEVVEIVDEKSVPEKSETEAPHDIVITGKKRKSFKK